MRFTMLILMFFNFHCFAKQLDIAEATILAERFVLENGYTNETNLKFDKPLSLESIEQSSDKNELLKLRFNKLEKQSLAAIKDKESWIVAFDYVDSQPRKFCRLVIVKLDGSEVHIAHQTGKRSYFLNIE